MSDCVSDETKGADAGRTGETDRMGEWLEIALTAPCTYNVVHRRHRFCTVRAY